jgi:hypothetical protein
MSLSVFLIPLCFIFAAYGCFPWSCRCNSSIRVRMITSMGQEAESTVNLRENNSTAPKCVARRQQTKQKSKCQLAAQGYNTTQELRTCYQSAYSKSRAQTRSRKNQKQACRQVGHIHVPALSLSCGAMKGSVFLLLLLSPMDIPLGLVDVILLLSSSCPSM